MKLKHRDSRNALSALRLSIALSLAATLPLLLYGSAPSWWSPRGVLNENAAPDDYAPANQGQLKNIARAAAAEMDAKLPGGAGAELHTLINGWLSPNPAANDFAPVNLGQLKTIAKPFYDRLIAEGRANAYPWLTSANPADDFSVANIGQVKNLFSFDLTSTVDTDGDGISDLEEFLSGTDPNDYFNGTTPVIEIVSGNNQQGDPGTFVARPLTVRVRKISGESLVNAPVNFTVPAGAGGLSATSGGAQATALLRRTDSTGNASAYYALPPKAGISTRVTALTGSISGGAVFKTFREVAKLHPTPTPTPTPDPNASPTPTPDPTATPVPPYRYAIIDLGKNVYPLRVNNKSTVLAYNFDPNGNWGPSRWKGGLFERLTYPDADPVLVSINDINDQDVVVGQIGFRGPWSVQEVHEYSAALRWPANSATGEKISGLSVPGVWPGTEHLTYKQAWLGTINNSGEAFGQMPTGSVRGINYSLNFVWNSMRLPAGTTSPVQISNASAANEPIPGWTSYWMGSIDDISRASNEHYIGLKLIPLAINYVQADEPIGDRVGMIDGQEVDFWPIDLNENGVVIGHNLNGVMTIRTLPVLSSQAFPDTVVPGVHPIALNDHTYPAPSPSVQSPPPSPQPTPIPAPQILSWIGNVLAILERQPDGQTWHPFGLEEMIPSMEGWDYIEPYDMNDTGAIVGRGWYTDPSIPNAQGDYHAFMLVPVELLVDGNRDGEMSFADSVVRDADQTSEDQPYRFWVNDDQDARSGTRISEEVTPPQLRDNQDEQIQSIRDCEDLARLWLNVSCLTESFKTGEIKLVLRFRNISSGNPTIRVFRAAENGGRGYVSNEGWGSLQASPPFDQALPGTNGPGVASSATGIHIDRRFWDGIDESEPIVNLLFEGVAEGAGELYCDIIKNGQRIGTSPGVWLDIKNVQKFYERAKAQPENIATPYFNPAAFTGPVTVVTDPNGHSFEKPSDETDLCVVLVHGWNVSYDEYMGVAQTLFKRLWHQGFKGHFTSFHWDTRKSDGMFDVGEYNRSENRAYIYGAALKLWISSLSNIYTVNLIGHSMGNVVCGEALRQGLNVRNYVLMEAAIPMSCYAADAARLPRLEDRDRDFPTPDYHRNPTTNESTLGYRGYIPAVGANLINFYNQDDWALATGTTEVVPGLPHVETNWEKNQIDYKPDGEDSRVIHAPLWRYYYEPTQPPTLPLPNRAWVESNVTRIVSDSWEMKAFVARSRTKAVGAFQNGNSAFTENVNLNNAPYNFGRERPDHSGQFTRDIQKVDSLYKAIRKAVEQ